MALKIFVRDLSNVKAEFRRLYVVDLEYGFRLDCDIDQVVHGLKSALKRERELNRDYKAAGVTPDGLAISGVMPSMVQTRPADVRAGLLPRRGTP